MWDALVQEPALLIAILAVLGGVLIAVVAILSHSWRAHRTIEVLAALKQDMLNRGLSADDIVRVVRASPGEEEDRSAAGHQETITDNEYYLVEKMLDEGRGTDEIERIIRAFKGNSAKPATPPALHAQERN
jgi:hypothetical protein